MRRAGRRAIKMKVIDSQGFLWMTVHINADIGASNIRSADRQQVLTKLAGLLSSLKRGGNAYKSCIATHLYGILIHFFCCRHCIYDGISLNIEENERSSTFVTSIVYFCDTEVFGYFFLI